MAEPTVLVTPPKLELATKNHVPVGMYKYDIFV